jgi:ATP-dependent Clp endopeptidase proteolytic subunit ClpP
MTFPPRSFFTELRNLEETQSNIDLLINSGGGEMFEGLPLYNNIASSRANITADIQGLAASMITIVMCGAKKVRAASNAMIMVHGPRGGDYTNIEGLETLVDYMKKMRGDMAKVYSKKTGKAEQWILDNWLSDGKDHWFTAQEAKDAGLVDEVYDAKADASRPQAAWPIKKIAAFYDEKFSLNNNSLNTNEPSMKKIIAALVASKLLQMPETANEDLLAEGVQTLVNQLSNKDTIIAQRDGEIKRLQDEAKAAATATLKKNAETMVQAARTANKIVAAQEANLIALASANDEGYNGVKTYLDSLQGYQSVNNQLNVSGGSAGNGSNGASVVYASLTDEFAKRAEEGSLETLKASNLEHFKAVYKAGTGKEFKQ